MKSTRTTILSNVKKLFDGKSDTPTSIKSNVDIHIQDKNIIAVETHDPTLISTEERTVINAANFYITPGIIDSHTHLTLDGVSQPALEKMNGPAWLIYVEKILYKTLVDGGVTSAVDVGGATDLIKRLINEQALIGPRLRISICMLSTTGGNADVGCTDRNSYDGSLLFPEMAGRPSSIVDTPWEARKKVRTLESLGADLIKVCTGRSLAVSKKSVFNGGSTDFTFQEV